MLHTIKDRDGYLVDRDNYTRGYAIKAMCTQCGGYEWNPKGKTKVPTKLADGSTGLLDHGCTSPHCPLYPYRAKVIL